MRCLVTSGSGSSLQRRGAPSGSALRRGVHLPASPAPSRLPAQHDRGDTPLVHETAPVFLCLAVCVCVSASGFLRLSICVCLKHVGKCFPGRRTASFKISCGSGTKPPASCRSLSLSPTGRAAHQWDKPRLTPPLRRRPTPTAALPREHPANPGSAGR